MGDLERSPVIHVFTLPTFSDGNELTLAHTFTLDTWSVFCVNKPIAGPDWLPDVAVLSHLIAGIHWGRRTAGGWEWNCIKVAAVGRGAIIVLHSCK